MKDKLNHLYVVVEPFTSDKDGYLSVAPGQIVELLEEGRQYWLVCTKHFQKAELECEGYLPRDCLTPLDEGPTY